VKQVKPSANVDTLQCMLLRVYLRAQQELQPLIGNLPAVTLFLSLSDGHSRARVINASGPSFDFVWAELLHQTEELDEGLRSAVRWLRLDWVTAAECCTMAELRARLRSVKRNYFRRGLALDAGFNCAFLEGELNANAMLYGGSTISHAVLNERNFAIYARSRFPQLQLDFSDSKPVWLLTTTGLFCDTESVPLPLHPSGPDAGRRMLPGLNLDTVATLIRDSSRYLATQVEASGRFRYGWHPCFDRPIATYNTLRHASTLYAMLEALEVTRDPTLEVAIQRSLSYLTDTLIKSVTLPDGRTAAFLVDEGNEIKLGGNAVCLLALCKHAELYPQAAQLALLEQLAQGIAFMQDAQSGAFVHVLNYPELSIKERFRVIYYDGEAAFGLMRLYGLTSDPRWLAMVENAFRHFIAKEYWNTHDHWLAYCVNELTRYRPEARYYEFALRNVADYLPFVEHRITTFPTLLELMMATELLLERMRADPGQRQLLQLLDETAFYRALERRARHLLNGHFWPELAMYFRNPARIVGSFFIRHHAFRVRIDDVEHYLSGFVAYRRHLLRSAH
jgi:hypothetical protein